MRVSEIKVESRARSATGWLDDLERSIEQLGVLQPIGVTPDNVLIFGARRLQACKNLGLADIPVRVIDIDADDPVTALRMEQAENNIRKDFSPSEKVEIARRIEVAMGNRRGQRTDLCKHLQESPEQAPSVPKGNSRDIAAKAVGWSGEQYRQAKKVLESDNETVKQALDAGELSVNRAYKEVAANPPPTKKTIRVKLAYNIYADAACLIEQLGGRYASELACEILRIDGHEVKHD